MDRQGFNFETAREACARPMEGATKMRHGRVRTGRRRRRGDGAAVLVASLLVAFRFGLVPDVEAQEPKQDRENVRVSVHGIVYDARTGTVVPGAAVYLEGEGYGVLSDSAGVFRFANVAPGSELVAAVQFGYEEATAPIDVPEGGAFLEIELAPRPILLDGVTAVVDNVGTMERRMRSRRRAVPYHSRAFDQERMLRSPAANVLDFLLYETRYGPVRCPAGADFSGGGNSVRSLGWTSLRMPGPPSSHCIVRRGRTVSPRVYVDEVPILGGLDVLESYPTAQIYALEIYSQGAEIRAYTYNFMQRMARRPIALTPINLWP